MPDHDAHTLLHDAAADVEVPLFPAAEVLARGRAVRRRRRTITGVGVTAGMVVVAATGVLLPSLVSSFGQQVELPPGTATAARVETASPVQALPQPAAPDRPITLAAVDIPRAVKLILEDGRLGPIVEDDTHSVVETANERIVHFLWDGTLTTVSIRPARASRTCREMAPSEDSDEPRPPLPGSSRCDVVNGLESLIWPAAESPGEHRSSQGVFIWQHGYVVSATSYDAADAKNPDGSEDVSPVTVGPAISIDQLIEIASSEVWFR